MYCSKDNTSPSKMRIKAKCGGLTFCLQLLKNSKQWREFGLKNVSFLTSLIKNKQLCTHQQCWRLCGHINANHSHIFCSCEQIIMFWKNLCLSLRDVSVLIFPKEVKTVFFVDRISNSYKLV